MVAVLLLLSLSLFGQEQKDTRISQMAEQLNGIWILDTLKHDSLLKVQYRTKLGVVEETTIDGEVISSVQKSGFWAMELSFNPWGYGSYNVIDNYGDTIGDISLLSSLPVPEIVISSGELYINWTFTYGSDREKIILCNSNKLILENSKRRRVFTKATSSTTNSHD